MSGAYEFVQVDVFTKTPLTGNPLAIFPDGRGLSDQQMQAIAREMNLSETTFILPREPEIEAKKGKRVRIFTPQEELPFAGHPTLGTALYLYSTARSAPHELSLDLDVGKIDIQFRADSGPSQTGVSDRVAGNVFGEMRQRDPEFGIIISREDVAPVIGIAAEEIPADWPVQSVSTGVPFAIVGLRDQETLANLKFDNSKALDFLEKSNAKFFYFVVPQRREGRLEVRARMFFYGAEDPATGSAAGCAASWMVQYGIANSNEQVLIRQGVEIDRPSEMHVRATLEGERVTNVRVGGYAVEVLRGTLSLPK